ncbi:RICIN domain-containing protein [Streptomyces sp. NPDC050147]|uniref:RICIN domain-containing protein n=1 Tax=Streptomyces sp. NPDC050147 TaxID=3155513 RepID=UPI003424D070
MNLAARLRGRSEGESDQPVALLLARHWQATYDYSAICLASSSSSASMVATASFHQMLEQLAGAEPGGALRPYLLVTVRETVRGWTADERISALMPELRKPTGGRGMRAATSMTPEKRRLAAHSFWALPAVAQCLLWHTAVEAEHISIPIGMSGLSADLAADALTQAREQFRTGIVRGHRELAPTKECPLYNRILDVTMRRGGTLLSDVRHHLSECRHCRDVTEQLALVESDLGTLLAEAVLGWGARRYLQSRPGRGGGAKHGAGAPGQSGRRSGGGGRHRPASHAPLSGGPFAQARAHPGAVRTGAALGSAALLATVLVITLSSGDGNSGGAMPPTGMAGSHDAGPSAGSRTPSPGAPTPTSARHPDGSDQGRLRNTAADLCLDIRGKVKPAAETKLAKCSAAASQQWSYDKNGLLSSVTRPDLCLDSHRDDGVTVLGACVAPSAEHADEVRYDLTVLGELLPRWHERLAVAPAAARKGADVVVKVRDGSEEQRWMLDSSTTAPNSRSIKGKGEPSVKSEESTKGEAITKGEEGEGGVKGVQGAKGGADAPRGSGRGGESGDGHACKGPACEPSSPRERKPEPPMEARERGPGAKGKDRHSSPDSTRRGDDAERYAEAGCCAADHRPTRPIGPGLPGQRPGERPQVHPQ